MQGLFFLSRQAIISQSKAAEWRQIVARDLKANGVTEPPEIAFPNLKSLCELNGISEHNERAIRRLELHPEGYNTVVTFVKQRKATSLLFYLLKSHNFYFSTINKNLWVV